MNTHYLSEQKIDNFIHYMKCTEYAPGTIEKYHRDITRFFEWTADGMVDENSAAAWKKHLLDSSYASATINSMIVALNSFFKYLGWDECRVKELRIQRRVFRGSEKELTKTEYLHLIATAEQLGKLRLALLMETICATGIRVSEVKYITVEALQRGYSEVALKGKIRTILIPNKLCRKLLKYAKKQKIASGEIFLTRSGRSLSRRQIWAEMKAICKYAGIAESKVFPHNLRHLFARVFYKSCRDVSKLADVLGHTSIETTRIYLISTGLEHSRQMERLGLIL